MLKRIAIGFLIVMALFVAGALWLYQDVMGPGPTIQADPVHAESNPLTQSTPATPAKPVAPIEAPSPVPSEPPGEPGVRMLTVTEREANQLVRTRPEIKEALQQANITDLRLRFEPDLVVAEARLPVWGRMRARVTASGRVWAQDGNLAFETKSVKAGSLPAPSALREELDRQLSAALTRLNGDLEGSFEDVQVRDGSLEIRHRE